LSGVEKVWGRQEEDVKAEKFSAVVVSAEDEAIVALDTI